MNILKLTTLTIIATILSLFFVATALPQNVSADASDAVCDTIGAADPNGDCSSGGGSINGIIEVVLNVLSIIAGVIAVIMIIIAGLKFITSQGDPGSVSSARNTAIYAIIGIVIVLISQVIVRFVINESTNLNNNTGDSGYTIHTYDA